MDIGDIPAVNIREDHLGSLLSKWSVLEPDRCRRKDTTSFKVLYADNWMEVTSDSTSHGLIVAAAMEGCHKNRIYFNIDYTPEHKEQSAQIEVGCIPKMFRWDKGDDVVYNIPILLLEEYLDRLQKT
jgi:hypothetical protein